MPNWSDWQPGWSGQFTYQPRATQVLDYNLTVGAPAGLDQARADSLRDSVVTGQPSLFTAILSAADWRPAPAGDTNPDDSRASVHLGAVRVGLDASSYVAVNSDTFMGAGPGAAPPGLPGGATGWEYESGIGVVEQWAPISGDVALRFAGTGTLAPLPLDVVSTTSNDFVPAYPAGVLLGHLEVGADPGSVAAVGDTLHAVGAAAVTVTPLPLIAQALVLAAPWARAGAGHIPLGMTWSFDDKIPSVWGPTVLTARTPRWRYSRDTAGYVRMTQRADGLGINGHPRLGVPAPRVGALSTL